VVMVEPVLLLRCIEVSIETRIYVLVVKFPSLEGVSLRYFLPFNHFGMDSTHTCWNFVHQL
jgi:hypothetical protein